MYDSQLAVALHVYGIEGHTAVALHVYGIEAREALLCMTHS